MLVNTISIFTCGLTDNTIPKIFQGELVSYWTNIIFFTFLWEKFLKERLLGPKIYILNLMFPEHLPSKKCLRASIFPMSS